MALARAATYCVLVVSSGHETVQLAIMLSSVGRASCGAIHRPVPRPCYDVLARQSLNHIRFISTTQDNRPFKNIEVEKEGHIEIISINCPEKRNCVNIETARELFSAFQSFKSSEEARVAILCGKGGTFCAGYDLTEVAAADHLGDVLLPYTNSGQAPMARCCCHFRCHLT